MVSKIYNQFSGFSPFHAASRPDANSEPPHSSPDWIQTLDPKWISQCQFHKDPTGKTITLQIGDAQIVLKIGSDITKERADFIVNAANEKMLGGGGVDGAIGRAGGEELFYFRQQVPVVRNGIRCPVGEARVTDAGRLPAFFCIHTVGPRFDTSNPLECRAQLSHAYSATLQAAQECIDHAFQKNTSLPNSNDSELAQRAAKLQQEHRDQFAAKVKQGTPLSISFPTISTGIFGYPKQEGAILSLRNSLEYLISRQGKPGVKTIQFVFLSNQADFPCYLDTLTQIANAASKS